MTQPTVTLDLTEQELRIIRRAVAMFAAGGADGESTEAWNLYGRAVLAENEFQFKELEGDDEGNGPDDYSDDAEALASAGMGTDEDYGYYGGDE